MAGSTHEGVRLKQDTPTPEVPDADGAFVGQCPGTIGPCCHGEDEVEVYRQLCEIVEEWVAIARRDGTPLPPPTAGTGAAPKIA